MAEFDLVIRKGTIATAADVFDCDIGIRDGRIAALAQDLGAGSEEIDARGLLVMPGGVDAHCHLDQPMSDGSKMADDSRLKAHYHVRFTLKRFGASFTQYPPSISSRWPLHSQP